MRRIFSRATLGCAMLVCALTATQFSALAANRDAEQLIIDHDLRVTATSFGMASPDPERPGFARITPTRRVPLLEGQGYGWRLELDTARAQVEWREVLVLPRAPREWGIGPSTELSTDRRRATTVRTARPTDGAIQNAWWFAPDDPTGRYRLEVYVEGVLVRDFAFEVR